MSEKHGLVWWSELITRDVAGAKAYYGALCGWQFKTMPMGEMGDYHMGMIGEQPVVGITDMGADAHLGDGPAKWVTYFAVEDVDAAVAASKAAGATVTQDPMDIPGTGRIAMLIDPFGTAIGIMTPAPMGS